MKSNVQKLLFIFRDQHEKEPIIGKSFVEFHAEDIFENCFPTTILQSIKIWVLSTSTATPDAESGDTPLFLGMRECIKSTYHMLKMDHSLVVSYYYNFTLEMEVYIMSYKKYVFN